MELELIGERAAAALAHKKANGDRLGTNVGQVFLLNALLFTFPERFDNVATGS